MPVEYKKLDIDYNQDKFAKTYRENQGQEIWKFLLIPANYIRYEVAVKVKRPPVEVIDKLLAEKFDLEMIKNNNVKQMIGHMIKQIMENLGYHHSSYSCRIQNNLIFSSGSKYEQN